MKFENILPIGSVIRVKEANKQMMIIGILQEVEGVQYDYIGVLYPEGFLTPEQVFLFNHEDIDDISFLGYMDIEHQAFRNNIRALIKADSESDT